jgi:hypothetical protein
VEKHGINWQAQLKTFLEQCCLSKSIALVDISGSSGDGFTVVSGICSPLA